MFKPLKDVEVYTVPMPSSVTCLAVCPSTPRMLLATQKVFKFKRDDKREQRAESREQRAESREQRAESREQRERENP